MGHKTCCVPNCKNTGRNSNCQFYRFPSRNYQRDQRSLWITAVKRKNIDGSSWSPKLDDRICNEHFIAKCKSHESQHPSYIPTIFPERHRGKKINEKSMLDRHDRFKKRQQSKKSSISTTQDINSSGTSTPMDEEFHENENFIAEELVKKTFCDQGCQAETFVQPERQLPEKTFICDRYLYENGKCEVSTQTDICLNTKNIDVIARKFKIVKCGPDGKHTEDKAVGSDDELPVSGRFNGFASIEDEEQLLDLAGVSFNTFEVFLDAIEKKETWNISGEDRLFIFLVKLKTGITYAALGVLFGIHRTTASDIFISILLNLAAATENLLYWPDKYVVQATMPDCLKKKYSATRVIIDCTEFRIETPSNHEHAIWCYSHYKHMFTLKVLIGITPAGLISFLSKAAGGRKSDSQITVESGLVNLLEDGDVVLSDKGFPEIKSVIDKSGKNAFIVMPPFLGKNSEFTKEEAEDTSSIASVRVHVERIMQRVRIYKILDKIPHNLNKYVDALLHVCCVLVNLQPPIFADDGNIDRTKLRNRKKSEVYGKS